MLEAYKKYYKDNPEGYWFKRKLYGWGWTPVTWQGWVLTLGYIVCLLLLALTIDESAPNKEVWLRFMLPLVALTAIFIRIAYTKGEKPKWQWGLPNKYKDNQDT